MMTLQDHDFDGLDDGDLRDMLENGTLIPLSMDQYALFKQKMDLQTTWDEPNRKPVRPTPTVAPNGGTVIKTQGKFAEGDDATEGGAAVTTEGSSKKEKKKGSRHV